MSMLDLTPEKRPSVSDIMTESFVMTYLIDLYCNIGAVDIKSEDEDLIKKYFR